MWKLKIIILERICLFQTMIFGSYMKFQGVGVGFKLFHPTWIMRFSTPCTILSDRLLSTKSEVAYDPWFIIPGWQWKFRLFCCISDGITTCKSICIHAPSYRMIFIAMSMAQSFSWHPHQPEIYRSDGATPSRWKAAFASLVLGLFGISLSYLRLSSLKSFPGRWYSVFWWIFLDHWRILTGWSWKEIGHFVGKANVIPPGCQWCCRNGREIRHQAAFMGIYVHGVAPWMILKLKTDDPFSILEPFWDYLFGRKIQDGFGWFRRVSDDLYGRINSVCLPCAAQGAGIFSETPSSFLQQEQPQRGTDFMEILWRFWVDVSTQIQRSSTKPYENFPPKKQEVSPTLQGRHSASINRSTKACFGLEAIYEPHLDF